MTAARTCGMIAGCAAIFKRARITSTGFDTITQRGHTAPPRPRATPETGRMSATVVTLWLANILLDTFGQLSFKAAAAQPDLGEGLARWKTMAARPWIWCGIGSYVGEFLVWLAFLSLVPLSEGVLLGSINIVAVMIAGRLLFAEKFSPLRTLGILLIAAGVTVVGLG
jgi:drug/metabolite transporter (DMT)-like permease